MPGRILSLQLQYTLSIIWFLLVTNETGNLFESLPWVTFSHSLSTHAIKNAQANAWAAFYTRASRRIWTFVGRSRQIYSLLQLTALPPTQFCIRLRTFKCSKTFDSYTLLLCKATITYHIIMSSWSVCYVRIGNTCMRNSIFKYVLYGICTLWIMLPTVLLAGLVLTPVDPGYSQSSYYTQSAYAAGTDSGLVTCTDPQDCNLCTLIQMFDRDRKSVV